VLSILLIQIHNKKNTDISFFEVKEGPSRE